MPSLRVRLGEISKMPRYGGVELGGWVPQARAQSIGAAGVDPEYYEMMQLNDYALAHPEARADTMKKYYAAMDRWGLKGNQYEQEAKALTEQNMKNNARRLYNENPGPGSGGFGLAQQIAGSVLANQAESILGARNGRIMLPAGNALETLDGMDLPVSEGLRRYAATSDALSQHSYNPDTVYDPKSFGFGYKSMGIGGNNTSEYGYGGDGHQFAQEGFQEYNRNANNAANQRRWDVAMANSTPLGRYQGASQEYLGNVPGWNNFPRNYGGPGASNGEYGAGSKPGSSVSGQSLTNGRNGPTYVDPNAIQDWGRLPEQKYYPPRYSDPTDPRSGYTPELGTQESYLKNRGKSQYIPSDDNFGDRPYQVPTSYTEGLMQPMAAYAKAPKLVQQGGPKPFGGSLSPDWTEYGRGYGQLFSRAYQQPRSSYSASSSFDRWQTDPFTAGQIGAFMQQR